MLILYTVVIGLATGALRALILQFMWNLVVPPMVPDAPILTFWTAWGVLIIASLLFEHARTVSVKKVKS